MADQDNNLLRLGKNIRGLRKKLGYSQEALALESSLDRSYIGGVERGERNISFVTLVKIAKALECDIADLTKGISTHG